MNENRHPRLDRRRYELIGWVLFLFSAFAFTATAVAAGDVLGRHREPAVPRRLRGISDPDRNG